MTTEPGKYTVIELSELLGVKRTTVNDWLSKYAVYIDFTIQGKRRIYSDNTLTVLKKIAELRGQGMSSFEIDSTLAKLYAIHPQPEPATAENAENTGAGESVNDGKNDAPVTETMPQPLDYQREQAEELLRQFRAMMEKIDRLEAAAAAQAALPPPPAAPPVKRTVNYPWLILVVLLLAAMGGGGYYGYMKMTALQERASGQDVLIREQQLRMEQQTAETTARLAAQEKLRLTETKALQEQAEKNRLALQAQIDEQRQIAEKAVAERKALEIARVAMEKQLEAQKTLAEQRVASVQKDLQQAIRDLAVAKDSAKKADAGSSAELAKLNEQIRKLKAESTEAKKTLESVRKEAAKAKADAAAARKKAEAKAAEKAVSKKTSIEEM